MNSNRFRGVSLFPWHAGALCAGGYILLAPLAFPQGSLTPPPGAPGATMKTLQQIEPRFDLQNAPAGNVDTTNASYHFTINQPGSYYLSANLGVTKPNGVQVNAAGVTIDLNGFEISRASGSAGTGIEIPFTSHRASVRNGSIKGFSFGINSLFSGASVAAGCAFRDLTVSNCGTTGIVAGEGAILESCRAHNNYDGFVASYGSAFTNCAASGNTAIGINANGSSLINCSVFNNGGTYGIYAHRCSLTNCSAYKHTGGWGIYASGSSLTACSATSNTGPHAIRVDDSALTNCTASYNTGAGIEATSSSIQNCSAKNNGGDGIQAGSNCQIVGNNAVGNGTGGTGAGIHVLANGGANRIERNNVINNTVGIQVDGGVSLVIGNSASGNSGANGNYSIVAGNRIGTIVTPSTSSATGNTGGVPFSTDAWVNLAY